MDIFILLDRTGSMAGIWRETVSSVNAYVEELRRDGQDHYLTLAAFDSHSGFQFDVLRNATPIRDWKAFGEDEVTPRGMTPLFDAIQRIVALAEARTIMADRTAIVVITDGHENASQEATRNGAKAAVERVQARGWQVVFLGANFDAFDQAGQVGVAAGQTISVAPGHMVTTMHRAAQATSSYATTGQVMSYTDEDRKASGEGEVTKKKR